ncbi:MAG: hypothetical protein GX936_00150 [Clostridiales bacterium]|nr:hypothetical protein [Clostridiales bacterium]
MKAITYIVLLTGFVISAVSGFSGCTAGSGVSETSDSLTSPNTTADAETQKPEEGELYTPANSKHFEKYTDPQTGAVSYILKSRIAALQQAFYFTTNSMTDDGRYFWFLGYDYGGAPNAGLIDFKTDTIQMFYIRGATFSVPYMDPVTGELLYACSSGIYKAIPGTKGESVKICDIPQELQAYGNIRYYATHITLTPEKDEIFLDARCGNTFVAGSLKLETGEFTKWKEWDYCRNHAQFNPVDRNLVLIGEDYWSEIGSQAVNPIRTNSDGVFMRLWTLTRDGVETLWPPLDKQKATHEWWSADGTKIYYCRYLGANNGICSIDVKTGESRMVAPIPAWHGFSSRDDKLFVYDQCNTFYRGCESKVAIYDTATGKSLYIISKNPALATASNPYPHHIDPHPRFVAADKYIVFTTTVNGKPDVALAPAADLIQLMNK